MGLIRIELRSSNCQKDEMNKTGWYDIGSLTNDNFQDWIKTQQKRRPGQRSLTFIGYRYL